MNRPFSQLGGAALAVIVTAGAFGLGAGATVFYQTAQPENFVRSVGIPEGTLDARAAILMDARTGEVLYQKNANEQLPLASLAKLMTAYVVLNNRPAEETIEITAEDVATEGNSGLKVGEKISLSKLLRLGLVASSNDAMVAALGSLGLNPIEKLNRAAKDLALTQSTFRNPTGLDEDAVTAGAEGSAYDVARLAMAFYNAHPDFFEQTMREEVVVSTETEELRDSATAAPLFALPGLIAAKTGTTDLAGANLVAVVDLDIGRPVIGVILGSTAESRFSDMTLLIEAARAQLQ
jgi:D-alanyl-D-alanine carboxypeptidase